ncbi:MAG: isovaleryl-CoA dehydrogenase [Dichotomicrobium sp.]
MAADTATEAGAGTGTHEVFNQSPVFADIDLYAANPGLRAAVEREGAGWASEELAALGQRAGSAEVLEWGRRANENPPQLRAFDEKGRRIDRVEYHPHYHALMQLASEHGLHGRSWAHLAEGRERRSGEAVARAAGFYLMAQAESGHCCPITMTHASVPTLLLNADLARDWLAKIVARDFQPELAPLSEKRAVKFGMGMTEKQGGTDVRANTTRAEAASGDGTFRLTGHKWFMSAPMSDAFFVLAQAPGGLSCFLVPRVLPDGTLNALRFQRLKDKLGNRSNASSEVELAGAHGWLVGEEGRGVPAIIEMVTYTRLDCALGSAGLMRLGLEVAARHCAHRTVFQKKLIDQPMMTRVLGELALDAEAAIMLAMRLAGSFDRAETDEDEAAYRRLMTPVVKYWVCKAAPPFLYEAMECLGGNGYVEEGPLARAYREAPVNAIWEGSGNVMCLDVLRVLRRSPEAAERVAERFARAAEGEPRLIAAVERLKQALRAPNEADGRYLSETLALVGAACEMRQHAPSPLADAFIASRLSGEFRYSFAAGPAQGDARAILAEVVPGAD